MPVFFYLFYWVHIAISIDANSSDQWKKTGWLPIYIHEVWFEFSDCCVSRLTVDLQATNINTALFSSIKLKFGISLSASVDAIVDDCGLHTISVLVESKCCFPTGHPESACEISQYSNLSLRWLAAWHQWSWNMMDLEHVRGSYSSAYRQGQRDWLTVTPQSWQEGEWASKDFLINARTCVFHKHEVASIRTNGDVIKLCHWAK